MASLPEPALVLEHLTVSDRRVVACEDVSLSVAGGTIYALLGHEGPSKSSIVACVVAERKPSAGHVRLFGEDARRSRRRTRRLVALISADSRSHPERLLAEALAREARILVLDDVALHPSSWDRSDRNRQLRAAASAGVAVFFATSRAADAEGLADRIGILRAGRLVLDEDAAALAGRFRKIRYRNEMTSTRTEYGTELDRFEAVRVRVRGWGVEARGIELLGRTLRRAARRRRYRGRRGGGDDARGHLRGDGTSPASLSVLGSRVRLSLLRLAPVTTGFFRKDGELTCDGVSLGDLAQKLPRILSSTIFLFQSISSVMERFALITIDTFFPLYTYTEKGRHGLLSLVSRTRPNLAPKLIEALKSAFARKIQALNKSSSTYTLFSIRTLTGKNMRSF